jgi:hypothetical protein
LRAPPQTALVACGAGRTAFSCGLQGGGKALQPLVWWSGQILPSPVASPIQVISGLVAANLLLLDGRI